MLNRFRSQFGAAGLIVAVIALSLAMVGGAFAVKSALSGKQKKEVEKIAKKFQGTGPTGPQGAPGAAGTAGAKGEAGAAGAPGKAGNSATVAEIPVEEEECEERGGAMVGVENGGSGVEVCTGEKGAKGEPWTPESELPVGATETGSWVVNATAGDTEGVYAPISFPIKLAAGLDRAHTHFPTDPDFAEKCPEGSFASPKAPSGQLCVFISEAGTTLNATFGGMFKLVSVGEAEGTTRAGTALYFTFGGVGHAMGGWAVTG